ncbi:MAG: hypothetical protein N2202_00525 [Proteobacteria bacterium]|nr:hypothetical protein [Pseudomonadota bacterium]
MQKYDIIFLGKSSFTEDLHNHFQSHVNAILIDNSCIPLDFSVDFFPEITFIPTDKEVDREFGYIISTNFRFELNSNNAVTKIFLDKCFKDIDGLYEKLNLEASFQINYLNELILENFSKSPYSFLIKNFFRDTKNILRIIKRLDFNSRELKKFIEALAFFFAPGETNNNFYNRYIIFSLLTKKIYRITLQEQKIKQVIENDSLKEIKRTERGMHLIFKNTEIEGKFLISTIPIHILDLGNIKHPFTNKFSEIFYNIIFKDVVIPNYLPEYMLYHDNQDYWFIIKRENRLSLYKKNPLEKSPGKEEINKILTNLFPHLDKLPEYVIKPHIFVSHNWKDKMKLNMNKNFFFTKNIEYPYYGSDGEFIYRNIIKETLWKRLL